MSKKFVLIGAAGYIAPRHIEAIKDNKCDLIASFDIFDSVGILDSYFPNSKFFNDKSSFFNFIDSFPEKIDYASICSPNNTHKDYIIEFLKRDINVICEKPLVLSTEELDEIIFFEKNSKAKVNCVLQLRLHEDIISLKNKFKNNKNIENITLEYVTYRGDWYFKSWKGDEEKSGGLAANIGIHFFDFLVWIFGSVKNISLSEKNKKTISGTLSLEKANIKWKLSVDKNNIPKKLLSEGKTFYRSINISGKTIELSKGFTGLHKKIYSEILKGENFSLEEAYDSIYIASKIRNMKV